MRGSLLKLLTQLGTRRQLSRFSKYRVSNPYKDVKWSNLFQNYSSAEQLGPPKSSVPSPSVSNKPSTLMFQPVLKEKWFICPPINLIPVKAIWIPLNQDSALTSTVTVIGT